MSAEQEHQVVSRTLDVKQKVAALAPGSQADDIRAAVEALIAALAVSGYVFPRPPDLNPVIEGRTQ
jgi:hypothetical protein